MKTDTVGADKYAETMAVQLRKGFLAYCVLLICSKQRRYTSELIQQLHQAELMVVEGTIYPLLSRLQRDGLLAHEWQESEQGPPRKYYRITDYGRHVMEALVIYIDTLNTTLQTLQKGVS